MIRRSPETIVLRSSQRSENAFDLQSQGREKLRPFENMGVETNWQLRMPKAANQFDYETIADVLVTIEYTALESHDYREQVLSELDPRESVDRTFSFKDEFVDQWYDLRNPEQTAEPMTVQFETDRESYPPNLADLEIDGVQLYVFGDATALDDEVVSLTFTERGETGSVGGEASPIDGVVSTPTASSWNSIPGNSPSGEWTLSLPDTPELRAAFDEDDIKNMLFVVTVSGERPDWPA